MTVAAGARQVRADMQNVVLRCRFALGDIVLLTAAVRDLHLSWPGAFRTDVRTGFPELWAHNPHLRDLHEYDSNVQVLDCDMPLVERSDHAAEHALHGFLEFLGNKLRRPIRLTAFRGDVHLSETERRSEGLLTELTGRRHPYWLLNAGGKHDCTVKWWAPDRFQQVVDHFRGRIQFVQVGRAGHWHPSLRGVVDLRGRTSVRDLIRLVYHADGVLCGVTALMHLAAAVPAGAHLTGARPCVVIAGGREPPHWEAYPGHQFIHTVGALACCAATGCWKSRARPLGDGQDKPDHLCWDVRGELPACMDLIQAEEVIRRIGLYLAGRAVRSLSGAEQSSAAEAVAWSETRPVELPPLTFYNAPQAAADFVARIPPYPGGFAGRGIVICAGGARLFANAWVCIRMLRKLGCTLPIEIWSFGEAEMDATMAELVRPFGVACVDAAKAKAAWPARIQAGWPLKPYAIVNCRFEEVLLLDADNVPVKNPEYLFDHPGFQTHGTVLWPDVGRLPVNSPAWKLFDVPYRDEPEVESGQVLVDKRRCWAPLVLCVWYNEHQRLFYEYVHGDKETFHFAFRRLAADYAMTSRPVTVSDGAFFQHDLDGKRVFQHRTPAKWDLRGRNRAIPGFLHEEECEGFLEELLRVWDGKLAWLREIQDKAAASAGPTGSMTLAVVMASCAEREELRARTLEQLAVAGWPEDQVLLATDTRQFERRVDRLTHTGWRALRMGLDARTDYVLYLEDDVELNPHLFGNLQRWGPLVRRELQIGSLCNLGARELAWDVPGCAYLVHPLRFSGSMAVLLSRPMLAYCLDHWSEGPDDLDLKLGHLALQREQPVFVHCPSLAQHVGRSSTLGHEFREALDFERDWAAPGEPAFQLVPSRTPVAA